MKKNKKTEIVRYSPKDIPENPNYAIAKGIKTKKRERITVTNPVTNKKATITLYRDGVDDAKVAKALMNPKLTRDQKDGMLGQYLFERGAESASWITELMISKGEHTRQTQVFKKQLRYDFEMFSSLFVGLLNKLEMQIRSEMVLGDGRAMFAAIGKTLKEYAEKISVQRTDMTQARMQEKGWGIYIGRDGKAYDMRDKDLAERVKKDQKVYGKEQSQRNGDTDAQGR